MQDLKYEAERNKLIPEAERFANKQFGVRFKGGSEPEREEWTRNWNMTFHRKVERLYWEGRNA
jgi:hypothetical protein